MEMKVEMKPEKRMQGGGGGEARGDDARGRR